MQLHQRANTQHQSSNLEQLLSFNEVCSLMRKSRSGLYKLLDSDPAFPKPIKDGVARSARAFFAASEIAIYLEKKLAGRAA